HRPVVAEELREIEPVKAGVAGVDGEVGHARADSSTLIASARGNDRRPPAGRRGRQRFMAWPGRARVALNIDLATARA
ncbi:MAG TPA: hypothetical protein VF266_11215, partial [Thermoanaerobaculia bacterium]